MAMSTLVPIVRVEGEGEKLWFYGGGVHTWLATNAETGGAFLLFDDVMTRGKTTPLHSHPEVDETLYMLDGEILVHIDGREQSLLRLPPIAGVLAFPQPHRFGLHVEVLPRKIQLPISVDSLSDNLNDALPELFGTQLPVFSRHLHAMPVFIEPQPAP